MVKSLRRAVSIRRSKTTGAARLAADRRAEWRRLLQHCRAFQDFMDAGPEKGLALDAKVCSHVRACLVHMPPVRQNRRARASFTQARAIFLKEWD